jgi:replicative DNA helicase
MEEKELETAKKHLLLPEETTLRIMSSKFMTDSSYRDLIVDTYDPNIYLDDVSMGTIFECQMLYYSKYNEAPNFVTLKELLKRYCEKRENVDSTKVFVDLDIIQNGLGEFDETVIRDSVLDLISTRITYNAIIDNLEIIKTKKDTTKLLQTLERVSGLTLDYDLGLLYFEHIIDHIDELKRPELKIPLGYSEMDYVLNGGLYSDGKCLCLFIAPSHVGKSLMLSNIAVNLLQDNKFVVIVSLEMSEFVYATRVDAHVSELGINDLVHHTDELETRVIDFNKMYPGAALAIKEYAPNSVNSNNLRTYLERLTKKYDRKIDAIIIDYVDLLNPIHGLNRSGWEKLIDVAKEMRALSYYFNTPVISAVQTTREGFDTSEIGMQNTGGSIGIPQTADVMFSLYQLENDREMCLLRSKVVKNRLGGKIGEALEFKVDYNTLRITDAKVGESSLSEDAANIVGDIESDLDQY